MKVYLTRFALTGFLLLQAVFLAAQTPKREGAKKHPVDTIKPPAPVSLVNTRNCDNGVTAVLVNPQLADSLSRPEWLYVFLLPPGTDTFFVVDSLFLSASYRFDEITMANNVLPTPAEGTYYVKTAVKKGNTMVSSAPSNKVAVSFCSKIDFPTIFDRLTQSYYNPGPFINIQVLEFDIFDRMGNTIYSHKNNNISWDGKNTQKQPCAAGVYYYSCSYTDLASDKDRKKTISGMLELKN